MTFKEVLLVDVDTVAPLKLSGLPSAEGSTAQVN